MLKTFYTTAFITVYLIMLLSKIRDQEAPIRTTPKFKKLHHN